MTIMVVRDIFGAVNLSKTFFRTPEITSTHFPKSRIHLY